MNKNVLIAGGVLVVAGLVWIGSSNHTVTEQTKENEVVKQEAEHSHSHSEFNHHLHDGQVSVEDGSLTAELNSIGLMPKDGEKGAVGYGLITEQGTDAIVVSATHAGVLDSELQKDSNDPVWHNHIVKLGEVALCGENPGVIDITFESPGSIKVSDGGVVMANLPESFSGTHSLSKETVTFAPGTDIQKLVQFHLDPKFDNAGGLQAVCVTDIEEVPFEII